MAIWAGSTINSNETAALVNQLWNTRAIPMVRRKNGLLYEMIGKVEVGKAPLDVNWQKVEKVSGINVQFNLLGALESIATVADGSGETTTWGGTVLPSTTYGGVTLPLNHYANAQYFPDSELDRYQGDEMRMRDWIAERMDYLILAWENTFGNSFNTGTAQVPTRTQVCPWRHQISDGVSSGETSYQTYGLDRNDSGNADFRGLVTVSVGNLTLSKIRERQNTVKTRGGNPRIGVAETTIYNKIQDLVEAFTVINYDASWSEFGGEYVKFGPTRFILEQRMPTQLLGLLDPDSWVLWMRNKNITRAGIVPDVSRAATHVLVWGVWCGFFCNAPNKNALLAGVTS